MRSHWHAYRLEGAIECVLRQDLQLQKLEGRKRDLLRRSFVLEFSDDLPVIPFPQADMGGVVAEPNWHGLLLIDSATGEYCQRRQIVRLGDRELRVPHRALHLELQAVPGHIQTDAEGKIVAKQQVNLIAGE